MIATESSKYSSAYSFHILCVLSLMLLSGCSTFSNVSDAIFSEDETSKTSTGEWLDSDDLDTLVTQPYIDPLTRYILRNKDNEQMARQVEVAYTEQQKRCKEAFERIVSSNPDVKEITRFSLGYKFSCPLQVSELQNQADEEKSMALNTSIINAESIYNDLSERDSQQASECYLLLSIKNYTEAKTACSPLIERGDVLAVEGIAEIAHLEEDYENFILLATPIAMQSASLSFLMGQVYELGQGVPISVESAREWYLVSQQLGHSEAQAALETLEPK